MKENRLPKHIAIVMDGNGRWARKRFLPRIAGHRVGVDVTKRIIKHCSKLKIEVLSLFAFSSENWKRPNDEVNGLMDLFLTSLAREEDMMHENNLRLRFIGNRDKFNETLRNKIISAEKRMSKNTGMVLIIAADYGGQWDIHQACVKLAKQIEDGKLLSQDITLSHVADHLSFSDLPDPDLVIRTSGEMRISNFMLWQIAYAELYFTPTLWPDFNEDELNKAIHYFAGRERRFGFTSHQLSETTC